MVKNKLFCSFMLWISISFAYSQYDPSLVDIKTTTLKNETYSVVRMSKQTSRIKVRYFAAKDPQTGKSVSQRYAEWMLNKKIIAVSSGTYMTDPNANRALPVGICIDQGILINRTLANYDGLVIVYATGGIVASDIKEGSLSIKYSTTGASENVDVRKSLDKVKFLKWAETEAATVFQTHLFVYKNVAKIYDNSSNTTAARRFLAVCKGDNGILYYYVINLPDATSLLNGVKKAQSYLNDMEGVNEIVYLINLDPGSQDVFHAFDSKGNKITNPSFQGKVSINNAANLLVFYYE